MKVTIDIPEWRHTTEAGFSFKRPATQEEWERTKWHCPNCGQQTVFADSSAGDFYVGPTHICTSCRHSFYLPCDPEPVTAGNGDADRADALAAMEPVTQPRPSAPSSEPL